MWPEWSRRGQSLSETSAKILALPLSVFFLRSPCKQDRVYGTGASSVMPELRQHCSISTIRPPPTYQCNGMTTRVINKEDVKSISHGRKTTYSRCFLISMVRPRFSLQSFWFNMVIFLIYNITLLHWVPAQKDTHKRRIATLLSLLIPFLPSTILLYI